MQFLKLVLSFAPWLAFLLIARESLFRVKVGLVVALVLSIGLGIAKLNKGIIFWVSLIFFVYATIAVAILNDMWTLRYMGVLANGTLAAAIWLTILSKRPFTLDYAKEHTDPALWSSPSFLLTNNIISSVWGLALSANTALAFGKMRALLLPEVAYDVLSYATLLAAVGFTTWYPKHVHSNVHRAEPRVGASGHRGTLYPP